MLAGPDDLPDDDESDGEFIEPYAEVRPTRRDWESPQRMGYDPTAPVRHMELSAVLHGFGRQWTRRLKEQRAEAERMRTVLEGNGTRDNPGLTKTVDSHESVIAPTRKIANYAAGGVLAAAIAVVSWLTHRSAEEQAARDQAQELLRRVDRLEIQVHLNRADPIRPDPIRADSIQQGPRP